jgi:hypothetical protein
MPIISTIICEIYIFFIALLGIKKISSSVKNIKCRINKKYYLKNLASNLLKTVKQCNYINRYAKVEFNMENGEFYLSNADIKENTIFRKAFSELSSSIDDPRYVITNGKRVYQAPELIGRKKENVVKLHKNIFGNISKGIIYTRTPEGKQLLLKLKMCQEEVIESNYKIDTLDKSIIENAENAKVDMKSTKIDIEVMKDILENKNLIEEE